MLVVTTASIYADEPAANHFLEEWKDTPFASIQIHHTRDPLIANSDKFVRPIREATGIWFTGGDQSRLLAAYRGTQAHKEFLNLLDRRGVIGGTSAGAAAMSQHAIVGGSLTAELKNGFGFLNSGIIIDQHFLQRNRIARLLNALQQENEKVGFGVDISTALIVNLSTQSYRAVGNSYVLRCEFREGILPVQIDVLQDPKELLKNK